MTTGLLERQPTAAEVSARMAIIQAEVIKRSVAGDPAKWASARLGDTLWSGQVRIMDAVRDHRKVAAATCHEIGKSYDAGTLAAWWIDSHKPGEAYVVTTAPTNPQVRLILWKEIGRAHSRGALIGRVNQTEWVVEVTDPVTGKRREETVGIGRKPNDYAPAAFQGIHAPFVLVIIDEANGVRGPLHDALDSLMANDASKLLMIGNPDDPTGEFHDACKPNSGFHVVHIGAFDSPNFTGEPLPDKVKRQLIGHRYVEERRAKWAPSWVWIDSSGVALEVAQPGIEAPAGGVKVVPPEGADEFATHPFWQSKVLGRFPAQSAAGSLIPLAWIRAAQERTLSPGWPNRLGLDVGASVDGDPSCLCHKRGGVYRILWERREPDTMKTTGSLIMALADKKLDATEAAVDYIGVGRGCVDRAREQNLPVYPVQVGESSTIMQCRRCKHEWDLAADPEWDGGNEGPCPRCHSNLVVAAFPDLLSQLWWQVRGEFERGEVDLDIADESLAEELLQVVWEPNSKGQIKVFYLDGPSPNRADAVMIASANPRPDRGIGGFATW